MPKLECDPQETRVILYADGDLKELLRKLTGAEQQRQPATRVSLQTILRAAILDYARRRYPALIPKALTEETE